MDLVVGTHAVTAEDHGHTADTDSDPCLRRRVTRIIYARMTILVGLSFSSRKARSRGALLHDTQTRLSALAA